METWKEYGSYLISNHGNVKRCDRLLKLGKNKTGYLHFSPCYEGKAKTTMIHRVVAELFIPNPENKKEVDHIDGDKTNNKVENLRWATRSQNAINKKGNQSNNKSGYKGVYWSIKAQKWVANIGLNGKNKYLGLFKTAEEAYEEYKKASHELFGEFSSV